MEKMQGDRYELMVGNKLSSGEVLVKCFGALELHTQAGRLTAADFASPQCCTMLVYLLTNRHRNVSIQELGEVLWPSQTVQSPYNMIKNIVLRTRRVLERICDEPFIVISNGIYGISPELKIIMETDLFEEACHSLDEQGLSEAELDARRKVVIEMYGGTLFPTMTTEPWLSARRTYYQMLYTDCVLQLMKVQKENNNRLAMYRTASSAAKNVSGDGAIQYMLLQTELEAGNIAQARVLYFANEALFTDDQKRSYAAAVEKIEGEKEGER